MSRSGNVVNVEKRDSLQIQKSKDRLKFSQIRNDFVRRQSAPSLSSILLKINQQLGQLLLRLPPFATIASYRPHKTEVPIHNLEASHPQLRWVYPKVQGLQLQFFKAKGFTKGKFGIDEPTEGSEMIPLHEINMVLIPTIALDHQGHRLGSGRGFYDRSLSQYNGIKVGVTYKKQVSPYHLTMETHDVPMEYIVTEDYILKQLKGC